MEVGKICVSVAAADAHACAALVEPVAGAVDAVEIRLDCMTVMDVEQCCRLIPLPLLFTNRPTWEGGRFDGSEEARIEPLCMAASLDASWIDLELRAAAPLRKRVLEAASGTSTRLILSWHDFEKTPERKLLRELLVRMRDEGADIGKIVTTAHDLTDVLRVLSLLEEAAAMNFPLSAFCMGAPGRISRFATLYLGGFMSYGSVDERQATAPGQLSVTRLHSLRTLFTADAD